jgi:hypothetical protein
MKFSVLYGSPHPKGRTCIEGCCRERVLRRRTFGPMREINGKTEKTSYEELHNLYSLQALLGQSNEGG